MCRDADDYTDEELQAILDSAGDYLKEAVAVALQLYETETTGGNLHIVLDDGNLRDSDIDFCRDHVERDQRDIELVCLKSWRSLTYDERVVAYRWLCFCLRDR